MEKKWIEDLYDRELARLQPILDAVDASPKGTININGYVCSKNHRGYHIGADEYGLGMIEVSPEKESRGDNGTYRIKEIAYCAAFDKYLGNVQISSREELTRVRNWGLSELTEHLSKGTILENALQDYQGGLTHQDELRGASFWKGIRDDIQKVLIMLKSLGVEMTPEENMAFLRGRKEELETELAQVNEQLNQKDSQQK